MKIYTRKGDQGQTQLPNGKPLSKSDPIFDALGELDLLNAHLGLCASFNPPFLDQIQKVQNELFSLGANLANPDQPPLPESAIQRLEGEIDQMQSQLPPLKNFILPGGTPLASQLHVARAVCRSAERKIAHLPQNPPVSTYLNRLADWLFVLARYANHLELQNEPLWSH